MPGSWAQSMYGFRLSDISTGDFPHMILRSSAILVTVVTLSIFACFLATHYLPRFDSLHVPQCWTGKKLLIRGSRFTKVQKKKRLDYVTCGQTQISVHVVDLTMEIIHLKLFSLVNFGKHRPLHIIPVVDYFLVCSLSSFWIKLTLLRGTRGRLLGIWDWPASSNFNFLSISCSSKLKA